MSYLLPVSYTHLKVGMTGEITLRGRVLPIGGLKEKLLAAKRAGLEKVVLPEKNRQDLEEVPENILKGLKLEFVETIDEVLKHALERSPLKSTEADEKTKKPESKKPVAEQPVTEKTVAEQPVMEQPVTEQPSGFDSTISAE